jgi:hypothetical protein
VSLPPVLKVTDVMARYGMRDERTARRLMNEAGAFKVGGRLVVREDFLEQHERRLATPAQPVRAVHSRRSRGRRQASSAASPASGPDWWREVA